MADDDPFIAESQRARGMAAAQLQLLWDRWQPSALLERFEPSAPMAVFAVIRSAEGHKLAQVSAHASAANVLIGEAGDLCAFHDGTAEDRAQQVYGAVAAVLALHASAT